MAHRASRSKRAIRPFATKIVNGMKIVCFTRKVKKKNGSTAIQGYCRNMGPVKATKPKSTKRKFRRLRRSNRRS